MESGCQVVHIDRNALIEQGAVRRLSLRQPIEQVFEHAKQLAIDLVMQKDRVGDGAAVRDGMELRLGRAVDLVARRVWTGANLERAGSLVSAGDRQREQIAVKFH